MKTKKHWYDYLWIAELIYFSLGFFNILFAWVGLCMFFIPLLLALAGWDKAYCNRYCGRGQLFALLGGRLKLSRYRDVPGWLRSRFFRYGFLVFFMVMFCNMLHVTRLWILQYHDHVYGVGPYFPVAVEAPFLVRVLPHGDHDAVNLQGKT